MQNLKNQKNIRFSRKVYNVLIKEASTAGNDEEFIHSRLSISSTSAYECLDFLDPNMVQQIQDPLEQFAQVTANWNSTTIQARVCLGWTVEQTLNALIISLAETHVDFTAYLQSSFMIGKVDRKCPGMQTWMEAEFFIYEYDILQGVCKFIIVG